MEFAYEILEIMLQVQSKFYKLMGDMDEIHKNDAPLRILSRANATDCAFIFAGNEHCHTSLSTPMDKGTLRDDSKEALSRFLTALFEEPVAVPQEFICSTCSKDALYGCDSVLGSGSLVDNCGECQIDMSLSNCSVTVPLWATAC